MKVGDLVKFPGVVRSRTEPRVYDDDGQHRMVGIIIEVKDWADSGDPDNNWSTWGTNAYVMWDSGEIGVSALYNLVRVDDESR